MIRLTKKYFKTFLSLVFNTLEINILSKYIYLLLAQCEERIHLQCKRPGFDPWVGKSPWRRERLPTPVFWPGEFHGLWGCRDGHN